MAGTLMNGGAAYITGFLPRAGSIDRDTVSLQSLKRNHHLQPKKPNQEKNKIPNEEIEELELEEREHLLRFFGNLITKKYFRRFYNRIPRNLPCNHHRLSELFFERPFSSLRECVCGKVERVDCAKEFGVWTALSITKAVITKKKTKTRTGVPRSLKFLNNSDRYIFICLGPLRCRGS